MFKTYPVWLSKVRPIFSNNVVFLGMNIKEKLVVAPTGMYLGLMKWVFLLDDSPNYLGFGITRGELDWVSS